MKSLADQPSGTPLPARGVLVRGLLAMGLPARRRVFAALVAGCVAILATMMALTLSAGGFGWAEGVMLACFVVTLPWMVIGFWNALLGLVLMRGAGEGAAAALNPALAAHDPQAPLTGSTAILSCIRNEETARIQRNLEVMLAGLERAGVAEHFSLYILSDTSWEDVAADEEAMVRALKARWDGRIEVTYRRRAENTGFKAGNIRDFCERWGGDHDFALVLDADSYMSASAVTRLVRLMQATPSLGIAQSLVVGLPTASAFARLFQFGMRLGMRSYTLGSAWWQGDCGPYWGHNALIRLKPFIAQCRLDDIPGEGALRGPILSHDQVEAVLMRRAGYEVRVVADEEGSFEENPPDLLEFIRRDLRWCQGNMQYLHLLGLRGLRPVSRMQLVLAILMFLGSPAWVAFMLTSAVILSTAEAPTETFDTSRGLVLFTVVMAMVFAPKIATISHILSDAPLRRAYGGARRIVLSSLGELVFSMLLAPVMAIAHTVFLAGLPFGRRIGWSAPSRATLGISARRAALRLWPQALFGLAGAVWLALHAMPALLPALPVILGPLLAIPLAVWSGSERAGLRLLAGGLWRLPEETAPTQDLLALHLPALPEPSDVFVADASLVGAAESLVEAARPEASLQPAE